MTQPDEFQLLPPLAPKWSGMLSDPRGSIAAVWDEAFTEYFDREGWTIAAQGRVMVERWETLPLIPSSATEPAKRAADVRAMLPDVQSNARLTAPQLYARELARMTLPELITRFARTYHRWANQPTNAELGQRLNDVWAELERKLIEWNRS